MSVQSTGAADKAERMVWWHDYVVISKIGPKILNAELMTTGQPLTVEPMSNARWKISGLPTAPPDDLAPVIKIEFEYAPYMQ